MVDILCQFCMLLGLAFWLPAPAASGRWLGARFALAGYIVVIYLFVGDVLFGLPVSLLTWAALAVGLVGLVAALSQRGRRPTAWELAHPVFVLTVLLFAVVMLRGGISYQPYLGDELASWLNLTKQIYLADHYHSSLMDYHLPDYTDGWPLLLAATSSVYSTYTDAHAVSLQFFLHLGILAFVYDIVRIWVSDARTQDEPTASLAAWVLLVVFLAGEITWRLLPTDLLIEQPMLYAYAACFLLAIAGQDRSASARRLCVYWGAILCAGYLFKNSMLAVAPTLAFFILDIMWREIRIDSSSRIVTSSNFKRLCIAGALAFVPAALAMTIWTVASPGNFMNASVGSVQASNLNLLFSADGWAVTGRMLSALYEYGASYKLPLTLIAAIGALVMMQMPRWRSTAAGFVVFFAATWFGLYLYYLYREPVLVRGYLESFQRFIILPIRLFHLIGVLALTYAAIHLILPRLVDKMRAATLQTGLIALVAVGLAWQVRQVARGADDMADRRYQNTDNIQSLARYRADIEQIVAEIERRNLKSPRLGIVDLMGYDVAFTTALYYSLKTERGAAQQDYRYFRPVAVRTLEDLAAFDIIWPVSMNDAPSAAIAAHLTDRSCAEHLTNRILVKADGARFDCIAKANLP